MNYYTTNSSQKYSNIKIEYHNALDSGRIVSQIYPDASGKPPTQVRKIITHFMHTKNELNNAVNESSENNFKNNIEAKISSQHKQEQQLLEVNGNDKMHNNQHLIKTEKDLLLSFNNNSMTKLLTSSSSSGLDCSNSNSNDNDYDVCTDGNLSWLLNYKIHELPELPDTNENNNNVNTSNQNQMISNNKLALNASNSSNVNQEKNVLLNNNDISSSNLINSAALITLMGNNGHIMQQEPNMLSNNSNGPKKPPFTYTELIEHALIEKGELTVSGIYQWISDHFPFYKQNDDRWKNSVRHNLSINPHFRKGGKAVHGAGHLWTIAQKDEKKTWQIRQKMQDFIKMSQKNLKLQQQEEFDKELQAATESILGEIQAQSFVEVVVNKNDVNILTTNNSAINNKLMENHNLNKTDSSCIEVEYINLADGAVHGLEDFLSPPVSKQEIVNECGLGSDFFITDINPAVLGLNLATNGDTIGGNHVDRMYDDEMSFVEYYDMKE